MFGRWVTVIDRTEYEQRENTYKRKLAELEKVIQALHVDHNEYEYLKHLADTLVRLEKRLHNSDNASEILKETFRTACEFYDADWAGFLEVDPDTKVWWPFDWLSVKSNDMTKSYLNEFEPLSVLPRWYQRQNSHPHPRQPAPPGAFRPWGRCPFSPVVSCPI